MAMAARWGTTTDTVTIMATSDSPSLLRLMTWMSPAYPVGAYTYSHGLEWAVEAGDVMDARTLEAWIDSVLSHGAGRNDAILAAAAWRAARDDLPDLIDLALALNPTAERLLETESQGRAFVRATAAGWPDVPDLDLLAAAPYPVAVGAVAKRSGIGLEDALPAFLHGVTANLVSAGVRLIPLGQSEGVRLLAALEGRIAALAQEAAKTTLDDLGGFAPLIDIASMKHETQYTRLFRS